jgi:hypothetical protein
LWVFELCFWLCVVFVWVVIAEAWLVAVGAVAAWALVAGSYRVALHRSTPQTEARKATTAIRSVNRAIGSAMRSVRPGTNQRTKP